MKDVSKYRLKKVLGLSFGLAVMVGGIIGVGILRNPGLVAAILPYKWLIISAWFFGGVYVLMALGSLAELAAMLPKAGGTFNYVKRAYGDYPGFVIGWFDYINNAIAPGYFSIVIAEYLVLLFPATQGYETFIALSALMAFTLLNLTGVKSASLTQQITSFIKVFAFLVLVICCFLLGGYNRSSEEIHSNLSRTVMNGGLFLAFIKGLQLALGTYDGWNAPTFMAEEDTNPGKNIPRSLFGGAIIVMIVYVSINIALLYVLPVSAVAGSQLAVADAAQVILGKAGYTILLVIALFSLLSILNAQMMISSRILYGLSHEGLFIKKGTLVNKGGTPYVVMIITALIGIITISIGSFERLFSLSAFITVASSIMMFASLFRLRKSEPDLPRPYKAWGYPLIPLLMLLVSITLFISYAFADTKNFFVILTITALTWPGYWLIKRRTQ
ncbi:MAG: APC family permease [Segetibacter sp.]|nr:APC family permease [Segetibacter sp.]